MGASEALGLIDWWLVASSALWILGLGILLAALGYHDWVAHETGRRLREQFSTRSWRVSFALGMTLFCSGLEVGRHAAWWERVVWSALAVSFVWQPVQYARTR